MGMPDMTHELKTLPVYWDAVASGQKPFEVRLDDRGFKVGDTLRLLRHESGQTAPSMDGRGQDISRDITYVLRGGQFGIEVGYVVLGLREAAGPKAALAETTSASLDAIRAEALRGAANMLMGWTSEGMTYISFCSGIEAATVAWHPLGWKPIAFCEINKAASRVLAHHYPDVPNLGDFTAVDWSKWSTDICVGGTPCQAFSVAGLRKSLADDRGNLSLEFIRAVNVIRPRFVVWENVPGVLSTSDNAFGCFLAGLVGCAEPIVFEQGFSNAGVVDGPDRRAAWRILDAQYFGLAQRRKRVFVVASSGDELYPAKILFEWESLRRDYPPSRGTGEGAAVEAHEGIVGSLCAKDDVAMCLNAKGGAGRIDAESETFVAYPLQLTNPGSGGNLPFGGADDPQFCLTREEMQGVAHSLLASGKSESGQSDGATCVAAGMAVRRLTPLECERLQGFPPGYTALPGMADGNRYKMLGNSMAVPCMSWIGRRIQEAK